MRRRDKRAFLKMEKRLERQEFFSIIFKVLAWTYALVLVATATYSIVLGKPEYILAMALPILYAFSIANGFGIKDILWVMFLGDKGE